jgi:hypothetical protein
VLGTSPRAFVTLLVIAVAVWVARRLYHRARHVKPGRPSARCWLCERTRRKEAARRWADYQHLIERQQRQRHAMNYERLREQERQWRQDGNT